MGQALEGPCECPWALVDSLGPVWRGARWALVGQALVGPLGRLWGCLALVGRALVGPREPLWGHLGPWWDGPCEPPGALMGWALMGPCRIYIYIYYNVAKGP